MSKLSSISRENKIWMNLYCPQSNNWIVQSNYKNILSHGDSKYHYFYDANKEYVELSAKNVDQNNLIETIRPNELKHIYFTYMTDKSLITLIEDTAGTLFLVKNYMEVEEVEEEEEEEEEKKETSGNDKDEQVQVIDKRTKKEPKVKSITSNVYVIVSMSTLFMCLSGNEKRLLGLIGDKKCLDKKNPDKEGTFSEDLKNIYVDREISFIDLEDTTMNKDDYVKKLDRFIDESDKLYHTLDLSHNYMVTHDRLGDIHENTGITRLLLNQNNLISDLKWTGKLPNLEIIEFRAMHRIDENDIKELCDNCPNITTLTIANCLALNLRCFLHILKLRKLVNLVINDENFFCQTSSSKVSITAKEWKNVYNKTLKFLSINSKNNSLDVVHYLVEACENLEQFGLDDDIFTGVKNNGKSGTDNEAVIFFSIENQKKGLKFHRRIHFSSMYKDLYANMYSKSMLDKIARNDKKIVVDWTENLPHV